MANALDKVRSSLVEFHTKPESWTDRRETDARTGVLRGLKEYLEDLKIDWPGGRQVRFTKVFDTWSAPENIAEFPCAIVYVMGDATYDAHNFTPNTQFIPGAGRLAIRKASELTFDVKVECWCNEAQDRMAVVAMLEDAFDPVDWMSGFVLQLPHYFNARGVFLKTSSDYGDAKDTAQRRIRMTTFTLQCSVDQLRLVGELPAFRPSVQADVSEDGTGELITVTSI